METSREFMEEAVRLARASLEDDVSGVRVDPALFGRSPAQVYARLGTPTVVGNSPGRIRWIYDDPTYALDLVVTFFDGYVAWVHLAGD